MAIHRTPKDGNFVMIDNKTARDPKRSLASKGLLLILLTYSDNFPITIAFVSTQCSNSLTSIRSAFRELMKSGHLVRKDRKRLPDGTFAGSDYDVYECNEDNPFVKAGRAAISMLSEEEIEEIRSTPFTEFEDEEEIAAADTAAAVEQPAPEYSEPVLVVDNTTDRKPVKNNKKSRIAKKAEKRKQKQSKKRKTKKPVATMPESKCKPTETIIESPKVSTLEKIGTAVIEPIVEKYVEKFIDSLIPDISDVSPMCGNPTLDNDTHRIPNKIKQFFVYLCQSFFKKDARDVENSKPSRNVTDRRTYKAVREDVIQLIEADTLKYNNPNDTALIDEIVEVITQTLLSENAEFSKNGVTYDSDSVKERMFELRYAEIEHLIYKVNNYNKPIGYRFAFLKSCLFTAKADFETDAEQFVRETVG